MKFFAIIVLGLSLWSCSDFLTEEVFTSVNPDEFYKNEQQVAAALNGAYSRFQDPKYGDHQLFLVADMSTDMLDTRWRNNVFNNYDNDKGHNQYRDIWEATWNANNAINGVIERSPGAEMNEELKARYIGEAKFLRALNYFNLVRIYGRVPLVLDFVTDLTDKIYPASSTLDLIYEQIITDLQDAEEVLPWTYTTSDVGRATKGAAKSLLGKVYLTYAGWRLDATGSVLEKGDSKYYQMAADKLSEVIGQNVYGLFEEYADLFKNETENGIEHIFSIQYKQGALGPGGWGGEGSSKQTRWAPKAGITHSAYETFRATKSFYASFSPEDKRKEVIFLDHFIDGNGVEQSYPETLNHPYVKKYIRDMREGGDTNFSTASAVDGEENTEIIRYADVLLMHSEALMEASQEINEAALVGINKVRERAGLSLYSVSDFALLDEFRNAILNEREWELCYEGHGWFDYTRMGVLADRVSKAQQLKNYYWPIPGIEITKNPELLQSPGW